MRQRLADRVGTGQIGPAGGGMRVGLAAWWMLGVAACADPRTLGDDDEDAGVVFDTTDAGQRERVRVATWNVEGLGAEGTEDWEAARDVLRRLDADAVILQEIDEAERGDLEAMADVLGYPTVELPRDQPFGPIGNAVLSRLVVRDVRFPTSATLSGDARAEDQTRLPAVLVASLPGGDAELTLVGVHLKSGFETVDLFRRAVDGARAGQAAASGAASDLWVVVGDFNEDLADAPEALPPFDTLPGGLPGDYRLGEDLDEQLDGAAGLAADPFSAVRALGLGPLDLTQRDGSPATRPTSGRRIDYAWVSAATVSLGAPRGEVYTSAQDDPGGLADGGEPLDYNTSNRASDHLPLLVELTVP